MGERQGRGEIPSFRNAVLGNTGNEEGQGRAREAGREAPVLGNKWQARMINRCLPRAQKKPRYVIPNNKLENYRCYMKDHALICKFIGYWPSEKDLTRWIQ